MGDGKDVKSYDTSSTATLDDQQWFHGMLPREDIDKLLTEDGQFLVRITEPRPDMGFRTVLSSRWKNKNYHFVIGESKGKFFIDKETFPDVCTLIDHYVREHIPVTSKSGAILMTPVKRQKWELKHEWITLDKFLGEGAFGEVYAGTLKLEMETVKVAVKVHKGSSVNKEVIAELCKEARMMRHYRHPNVIKFYGVAVEQDPLMLVMELVTGGALDRLLRKKKDEFTPSELLYFAYCASKGLEYLHENACIHRDVAARNCLVDGNEVKISDFGLSRELSRHGAKYRMTDLKQPLPIRWLAPEVMTTATYSTKSDVFSFGVLLWEIYSGGEVPYKDMTVKEVNVQVINGYRLSAPSKMPKSVREIMEDHCFPQMADDRRTMSQIRMALEGLLDEADRSRRPKLLTI